MPRCPSTTKIPNVRGRKDDKGEVITVDVRCEQDVEKHEGAHFNGHHGDSREHTREW